MAEYKEKKSLSHVVYDHLRNKILNNELLPGDKLIEMDIASDLEVSRTPVREALAKLANEHLAENFPRKSYIVSKISMKDAKDLYTVRTALEPLAAKQLAQEGITDRTYELKDIMVSMVSAYEANDFNKLKVQVVNFGLTLIKLTKNPILRDTLFLINEKLYRIANFIFREEQNIIDLYQALLSVYKAIENRNPEEAYEVSNNYVSGIYPMLESQNDYRSFRF